eukprot:2628775-Alexandrium_andersonii.AAC.2
MAGVGLHHDYDPGVRPPDDPVQAPGFLEVSGGRVATQSPHHLQEDSLAELPSYPLQGVRPTSEHEVAPVD